MRLETLTDDGLFVWITAELQLRPCKDFILSTALIKLFFYKDG